jgi:hypothetical protein
LPKIGEDHPTMAEQPPIPSTATVRAALSALRALRDPITEADIYAQFPLLFLPCVRIESRYEARPALFLTALNQLADELTDPVQRLTVAVTVLRKRDGMSLEKRHREAVDIVIQEGHRSKSFDARAEGDKALRFISTRLLDSAFAQEFAKRIKREADPAIYENELSDAHGYRWLSYDLHVDVPTPPSHKYRFIRTLTVRTTRPDQRFFLLDYHWTGSGKKTKVAVLSAKHSYLGSVPLPDAEGEDWNTLVFYLGDQLPLGAEPTISFIQTLNDELGQAQPIAAVAVRYEGMKHVTVSTKLPQGWKALRVDVMQDGFGTRKSNRKPIRSLGGQTYTRHEEAPAPGFGRGIEWERI